jgi:hypothetical protein
MNALNDSSHTFFPVLLSVKQSGLKPVEVTMLSMVIFRFALLYGFIRKGNDLKIDTTRR